VHGHAQAVTARDLSAGGMRLAPDPGIAEGDELKLALYGARGAAPLVLRGVVVHTDASSGVGLEFVDVPPPMQERLQALLTGSPISGPADPSHGRPQVVLTRIVDHTPPTDD